MPDVRFPKTSKSAIGKIVDEPGSPEGRKALSALCKAYWFPVYAFVRRRTDSADKASDLTQGFFTRLIEKNDLAKFDRARGTRFRSWLLGCVKHYLSNARASEEPSVDVPSWASEGFDGAVAERRFQTETAHDLTPDRLYERAFAENVLARALAVLREKEVLAGKEKLFEALRGSVSGSAAQEPHEEIARALGMTAGSVKTEASRLRKRFAKLLRAEVASLVEHPDDDPEVDEELKQLLAAVMD